MNTCKDCRWWVAWDAWEHEDCANYGNCRINPPAHFPKLDPWPFTQATDFCGKFEASKAEPPGWVEVEQNYSIQPRTPLPPPPDPPATEWVDWVEVEGRFSFRCLLGIHRYQRPTKGSTDGICVRCGLLEYYH